MFTRDKPAEAGNHKQPQPTRKQGHAQLIALFRHRFEHPYLLCLDGWTMHTVDQSDGSAFMASMSAIHDEKSGAVLYVSGPIRAVRGRAIGLQSITHRLCLTSRNFSSSNWLCCQ